MSEPPILSAPRVRLQARFLWICAGLFLGAAVLGYLCAPQVVPLLEQALRHPDFPKDEKTRLLVQSLIHPFHPAAQASPGDPRLADFFWLILAQNEKVMALLAGLGSLVFLYPALMLAAVGFLCGHVFFLDGMRFFAMRALPHGIVELPAAFLMATVALQVGWAFLVAPLRRKFAVLRAHARLVGKTWLLAAALIALAAYLETYGRAHLWAN